MSLRFAYGTNGLGDHRLSDACALLADEGYDGVALTLDHQHLDPASSTLSQDAARVAGLLRRHGLAVVVETGGRFVLDPRRKHHPTLVSAQGSPRRVRFYGRALEVCEQIGSPVLHMWSGVADPTEDPRMVWRRLLTGLSDTLRLADDAGVDLALEPEPGMVVDTISAFERVHAELGAPPRLRATLDIGHCRVNEPVDEVTCIARIAPHLAHVQIEDMRTGVHEHLPFGEGEIDFPPVLAALQQIDYGGLVSVELTRHGHTAHTMVPAAIAFLRDALAVALGSTR